MKFVGKIRAPRERALARLGASALGVGIVLCLALLGVGQAPARYEIGTTSDAGAAVSFWPRQTNEEGGYRWTDGDSQAIFYGYERFARVLMTARVKGPTGGPVQGFNARVPGSTAAFSATATPGWRVYQLFVPRDAVAWETPALHITGPVFKPTANDSRQLGVAVSLAAIAPVGAPSALGAIIRALFFSGACFVAGLAFWRAGAARWAWLVPPGLGGLLLIALAARPALLGYWLPTAWTALLFGLAFLGLPAAARALRGSITTTRPALAGAG
ncbi:MAG TPA: hypothetical protein VGE07_02400, partial [Herpetosiphonaceae bacterium]